MRRKQHQIRLLAGRLPYLNPVRKTTLCKRIDIADGNVLWNRHRCFVHYRPRPFVEIHKFMKIAVLSERVGSTGGRKRPFARNFIPNNIDRGKCLFAADFQLVFSRETDICGIVRI